MAVVWGSPVRIAAIDAGSNAIRLAIAEVRPAAGLAVVETERFPVRLGHRVFLEHRLDAPTIARATDAFRHFRRMLDRYQVESYRAVATSAAREARNRTVLLRRIRRASGIRLQVIGSDEEARLVRHAVVQALGEQMAPRLIFDLGGGSLEITLLHAEGVEASFALPLGTVRLMESLGLGDRISREQQRALRDRVFTTLVSAWPDPPELADSIVVGCGGNAEALARITGGSPQRGVPVLHMGLLKRLLPEILRLDVRGRMKAFGVRRDRSDVMPVAAVIFATLAEWLDLRNVLVPGVGVREGILGDLAVSLLRRRPSAGQARRAQQLLSTAGDFAAALRRNTKRAESVRALAASFFDQLAPLHGLPRELRLPLELAAVLHDVGSAVNPEGRQKHGEYLVRHGRLPGLTAPERELVACLVRYHDTVEPALRHKLYSSFSPRERRQVRALASLLRLAVALNAGEGCAVARADARINAGEVIFEIPDGKDVARCLRQARRGAAMFEQEFQRKAVFRSAGHGAARASTRKRAKGKRPAKRKPVRKASRRAK
jgi:exopolyphosphatase/guanosine-5'-triphosphate,3'-diphosphate pyrophosphatase